jgi:hypothetical protein
MQKPTRTPIAGKLASSARKSGLSVAVAPQPQIGSYYEYQETSKISVPSQQTASKQSSSGTFSRLFKRLVRKA